MNLGIRQAHIIRCELGLDSACPLLQKKDYPRVIWLIERGVRVPEKGEIKISSRQRSGLEYTER